MPRINRYVPKQALDRNHSRVRHEPYFEGADDFDHDPPTQPIPAELMKQLVYGQAVNS
jgi:hypothetical protein